MKLALYWVDAFAHKPFHGNPAGVVPLDQWLPDEVMQRIAFENGLAETAFFVKTAPGRFQLRWFTPAVEVDLCGHATLASAFGSTHCALIPYWAGSLGRTKLSARQLSARGGEFFCELRGGRVGIAGHAVLYLRGEITV
jgi:predicted PhzF superfamily epimerase YddE/YHI9